MIERIHTRARARLIRLRTAWGDLASEERGDVPGWVLITLMTAGLVVVIWALAGPTLTGVFEQAIDRVTGM
ncbi:hypothetical protein [Microbacterium indicum]|uniref:hypothetical protein n=1 Tax=Microbacterium indicum TaxID=358100 RepID=UPI0003F9CF04|nr:hypothetical protein [Microbacterium indicum]